MAPFNHHQHNDNNNRALVRLGRLRSRRQDYGNAPNRFFIATIAAMMMTMFVTNSETVTAQNDHSQISLRRAAGGGRSRTNTDKLDEPNTSILSWFKRYTAPSSSSSFDTSSQHKPSLETPPTATATNNDTVVEGTDNTTSSDIEISGYDNFITVEDSRMRHHHQRFLDGHEEEEEEMDEEEKGKKEKKEKKKKGKKGEDEIMTAEFFGLPSSLPTVEDTMEGGDDPNDAMLGPTPSPAPSMEMTYESATKSKKKEGKKKKDGKKKKAKGSDVEDEGCRRRRSRALKKGKKKGGDDDDEDSKDSSDDIECIDQAGLLPSNAPSELML